MDHHGAALRRSTALLLALPPLAFLAVFFGWPVLSILGLGVAPDGRLDIGGIVDALAQPFVLQDGLFTLALATAATLATVVCGLPVAYVFARFQFPGRGIARALATVPFVLPTVVVASAFIALLGPRNPLIGTVWAVLLASVFYNLAVVIRLVGGLWAHLDPRLEEAARLLGATPWRAFARSPGRCCDRPWRRPRPSCSCST